MCSKSRDAFLLGDGTTRGSCHSRSEKCQSDGLCKQCSDSSQCTGLSDTCGPNFTCGCGENGACNGTLSNRCVQGVCKCGSESACASSKYLDPLEDDPRSKYLSTLDVCDVRYDTTIYKRQRSEQERCEKVTSKYNPLYIPMDPRAFHKATINDQIVEKYITLYDDKIGSHEGEYRCLGKIKHDTSLYFSIFIE